MSQISPVSASDERRPILDVLEELSDVIEAVRGERDVVRVSGLLGDPQDVAFMGIDGLQEIIKRACEALRPSGFAKRPAELIPTPEQIEPILDDYLGVDSPHYEELRRRCAQRIFDLCVVMSGAPVQSSNRIASSDTSTVCESEKGSPVGWGNHLPGRTEP
jgi:hypothetical protein